MQEHDKPAILSGCHVPFERLIMNKPIIAAVASFLGWSVATLAVSYFKHGEPAWLIAIVGGASFAFTGYVIADWKRKKEAQVPTERNDK